MATISQRDNRGMKTTSETDRKKNTGYTNSSIFQLLGNKIKIGEYCKSSAAAKEFPNTGSPNSKIAYTMQRFGVKPTPT